MTQGNKTTIMALDVGERRIGVALASDVARLAQPLITLEHTADIVQKIELLMKEHNVRAVVVGLPRGLSGQATAQTKITQKFIEQLRSELHVPVHEQDEALTSRQAEAELAARRKVAHKGEVDALAATYILEDFLREHMEIIHG